MFSLGWKHNRLYPGQCCHLLTDGALLLNSIQLETEIDNNFSFQATTFFSPSIFSDLGFRLLRPKTDLNSEDPLTLIGLGNSCVCFPLLGKVKRLEDNWQFHKFPQPPFPTYPSHFRFFMPGWVQLFLLSWREIVRQTWVESCKMFCLAGNKKCCQTFRRNYFWHSLQRQASHI